MGHDRLLIIVYFCSFRNRILHKWKNWRYLARDSKPGLQSDGSRWNHWSMVPPPITETIFGEFSQIGQGSRNLGKNVKCLIWIWQNFEPTLALRICQWAIFLCCKMAKFRASDLVIWSHCPQFWPILKMLNKLFNNLGPEGHLTFEMIRI